MYWLGIAGSTLTQEQRILAQRSTHSQHHPTQKFLVLLGWEKADKPGRNATAIGLFD
jgi:hypothetical protein